MIEIFILSLIQGITEFLPISSSAHLIIFPNLLNNPDQGRVFDVAVHFGSLIAVILYFWRDIFNMSLGLFSLLIDEGLHTPLVIPSPRRHASLLVFSLLRLL